MSLLQRLLARKETRYLLSGLTSELIEYLSFLLLLFTTDRLVASNSISFLLGIAAGFWLHKHWTFGGQHLLKTRYQVGMYSLVATFNFVMTNVLVGVMVNGLGWVAFAAKLLTMGIIACWSYLLFNKIIFRYR